MDLNTENRSNVSRDQTQPGRAKSGNKLFRIISVVLFLVAAGLGWQFLEQKSIAENEKADKESVQSELRELLTQYETLKTDNAELDNQLSAAKGKIKEILGQIEKLETKSKDQAYWLQKYKKESKTLRRLLKGYLKELDSLGTTITVLEEEKTLVLQELTDEKKITQQLTDEKEVLTGKVELGSQLKTYRISVLGIRFKSGGKREREETRARKVEKIKTCFTIGANAIASSGERDIYIRVADQNGNVFPKDGDSTKVFMIDGKEIAYSAKTKLNYQNQAVDRCLYFANQAGFTSQKYTVDIFADGVQIGEGWIELE